MAMAKLMPSPQKKTPQGFPWGVQVKKGQRLTLPRFTAVPSAQVALTSLFGMGRGGPHRYSHPKAVPCTRAGKYR